MGLVRKKLTGSGTFTVPAGVSNLKIIGIKRPRSFITTGKYSVMVIDTDNTVYAWGDNTNGEFGDGTLTGGSSPSQIQTDFFDEVSLGYGTGVFNNRTQLNYLSGFNDDGQLGNNSVTQTSDLVQVSGNHIFTQISSKEKQTYGLKRDGTIWSWGDNTNGILGNNTTTNTSSPVQVVGQSDFIQLSNDNTSSGAVGALKSDGTVWMWGSNLAGELGNNNSDIGGSQNQSSPVQVAGQSDFIQLACGSFFSAALKSDGTVWTWGSGSNGELGNNTTGSVSSPVQVVGESDFVQIHASFLNVMAVKSDGTIWGWGENSSGQLGNNTTTDVSSPVQVVGQSGFFQVAVGGDGLGTQDHAVGLKSDGTVWAWGYNGLGQLGDNSTTSTSSPVQANTPTLFKLQEYQRRVIVDLNTTPNTQYSYSINGNRTLFGSLHLGPFIKHIVVEYNA